MIRVFPRRTKWTPIDRLAFVGDPPHWIVNELLEDRDQKVMISCTFTWDIPEAERLKRSWSRFSDNVWLGGPAYNDPGWAFVPGRFLKEGAVITSRGCFRNCPFCLVPEREGHKIRQVGITQGWNVFDSNILGCDEAYIRELFAMLATQRHPAVFSGGLDTRLLEPWHVDLLGGIRLKRMYFACDSPETIPDLKRCAEMLGPWENGARFPRDKRGCYVLIGFRDETPRHAEARLKEVYAMGFLPFAMHYRGPHANSRNTPEFHDLVGKWRSPRAYKMMMEGPRSPLRGGTQLRIPL